MQLRSNGGLGAGALLVAAALSGCGSATQPAADEIAPERATAAVTAPAHDETSATTTTTAGTPAAPTEVATPSATTATTAPSADTTATPTPSANVIAAVGPESNTREAARPRRRPRATGAAVNSARELPVAAATAAPEREAGPWRRPYPVSRAGIRWDREVEERPRVIRRQARTAPAQAVAAPTQAVGAPNAQAAQERVVEQERAQERANDAAREHLEGGGW